MTAPPSGHATIAAIATPAGRGGIGIVRVSGPGCRDIGEGLLGGLPPPRVASLRAFLGPDGDAIDEGIALYFPAPHSLTGEDVLELQGHGGPVVLDMLLRRVLAARRAPGRTRRVHATGVPERQARPRAGRSDRRPHRQRLGAGGARRAAVAARRVLDAGARADRGIARAADVGRGCDRFPGGGDRFPRRPGARRAHGRYPHAVRRAGRGRAPGRAAAGRAHARDRRAAECRQVEPAESPRRLRRRHRDAGPRHDPRRAARTHRDRRVAAAHPRHRGPARVAGRSRGRGDPPCASRDRARGSRAVRRRRRGPGSGCEPSTPISPRCRPRPRARW